jgi:hypothetical protein
MDPIIISVIVFGSVAYVGGTVYFCWRVCQREPLLDPLLDVSPPLDPESVEYPAIYPTT